MYVHALVKLGVVQLAWRQLLKTPQSNGHQLGLSWARQKVADKKGSLLWLDGIGQKLKVSNPTAGKDFVSVSRTAGKKRNESSKKEIFIILRN